MRTRRALSFFRTYIARPFFVFLGITVSIIVAQAAGSKGQLYIPFSLITSQLQTDFKAGSPLLHGQLPDQILAVDGLQWQLSAPQFDLQVPLNSVHLDSQSFSAVAPKMSVSISLDQISVNQDIQQNVGGAILIVHVQAQCGPIQLTQDQAQIGTVIAVDWSTGAPLTKLTSLDVNWTAGSWKVATFTCVGPTGIDTVMHDKIAAQLLDAASMKPLIAQFISSQMQGFLNQSLSKIQAPFVISNDAASMPIQIGKLNALATGVVADVSFGDLGDIQATSLPLPTASRIAQLPDDRPSLIAGIDLISLTLAKQLATQPADSMTDLQTNSSFHSLMNSRIAQLFVWSDLMNYPSSIPFYLRLHNPGPLTLTLNSKKLLVSQVPVFATIQSYRDKKWWSFVEVKGTAEAEVKLSVSAGALKYATSIESPKVSIAYGDAYKAKYKPSGIPVDTLTSSLEGPSAPFSGTMVWPDIDLGSAGKYGIQSLKWLDESSFALSWTPKSP